MPFTPETAAEALLARLHANGLDALFANGGTDFASIIEAFARGGPVGAVFPEPVIAPHETAAVAMAHGRYLATGRPQAIMAHVTVGLANCVMGVVNAAADNVPLIVMAGRTPITEGARPGSRDVPIHWGQDLRDSASMVRSACKWEYELRYGEEVEAVIDRAVAVAMTEPRGPVYLALPRESLAEPLPPSAVNTPMRAAPSGPLRPAVADVDAAANMLKAAKRPLLISSRGDADGRTGAAVQMLAEKCGFPVAEFWPTRNVMASDNPLHAGFETGPLLAEADVVLCVDALVPWIIKRVDLSADCKVIQLGADPLFGRFPTRGFPVDIALAGDPAEALAALASALPKNTRGLNALMATLAADRGARMAKAEEAGTPMQPAYVSAAVSAAIGRDGIIMNELGVQPGYITTNGPNRFFGHSLSAGLGWGFPSALGMAHAKPDALVAACIGDGSYMFANPVACGQISEALGLPILVVVMHNGVWNAVRRSTLSMYPDGVAAEANAMPITSLEPAPDYALIATANRGWSERVSDPARLPEALAEAVRIIREEKRMATLEVMVGC
jgi:acetolactate synthase-1/2/3 large subunit